MIGLAAGLLASAGLFAERAITIARSDGLAKRLGIERHDRPARSPSRTLVWLPAFLIACVSVGPALAVAGIAGIALIHRLVRRRRR